MESAPELLRLFVQALALFATSLDRWFQIPWPLPIAVLFVPVVAALDVVVWYLRGMMFPIPCGYPKVGQGLCSRQALGEWHRCWYHGKWRIRKTDRHRVDPTLRRWKTRMYKGEAIETAEVGGRGFLSMRSHRDTLLYHQGFTRPPRDVFKRIPAVVHDYKSRAMERWANLKSLGIRGLVPLADQGNRQIATSDVLPGVINATRLTLGMVALGLVLVGVSIVVPTSISVIFEYCATFSFIIALTVTRAGIWRAEPEWLGHSSREAGKWIAGLTALATVGGLIALYADDVKDVVKTIVQTVFSGFIFLLLVYLVYLFGSREKTKASKKKRRPRKRRRRRR